jgi:hypothetical protein
MGLGIADISVNSWIAFIGVRRGGGANRFSWTCFSSDRESACSAARKPQLMPMSTVIRQRLRHDAHKKSLKHGFVFLFAD